MLNSSSPSLAVEHLRSASLTGQSFGPGPNFSTGPSASSGSGGTGGGGLGGVFDTVNDGLSVFDRIRCVINPKAPGCYQPDPVVIQQQQETQRVWLYLGMGVIFLLIIVILIIALKK